MAEGLPNFGTLKHGRKNKSSLKNSFGTLYLGYEISMATSCTSLLRNIKFMIFGMQGKQGVCFESV